MYGADIIMNFPYKDSGKTYEYQNIETYTWKSLNKTNRVILCNQEKFFLSEVSYQQLGSYLIIYIKYSFAIFTHIFYMYGE
jgi:hypothetical protein